MNAVCNEHMATPMQVGDESMDCAHMCISVVLRCGTLGALAACV